MGVEGMPGDMEGAFLFLSSPISDFMPVDGGVLAA